MYFGGHFFFTFTLFKKQTEQVEGQPLLYEPLVKLNNVWVPFKPIQQQDDDEVPAASDSATLTGMQAASIEGDSITPTRPPAASGAPGTTADPMVPLGRGRAEDSMKPTGLVVKVEYREECRRFRMPLPASFEAFTCRLREVCEVDTSTLRLVYCDDEGDWVTFEDQESLTEGILTSSDGILRVRALPRNVAPSLACSGAAETPRPYEGQLQLLNELGFDDEDANLAALARCDGEVEGALEHLVPGW